MFGHSFLPKKFKVGPRHHNWRGGIRYNRDGRALVLKRDHPRAHKSGYVLRSVLVAEEKIGRVVLPTEDVHHINGDRTDDRPENLMVLSKSDHTRLHHQMASPKRHQTTSA